MYLILWSLCLSFVASKNLSDITYRFTTCNVSGLDGPTYAQCKGYYEFINSPMHRDGLLTELQAYLGGQGLHFPDTGLYNVTVAGASGGRGLCNTETGHGAVFKGQMYIEQGANDSVLVLVGHKGRGPCDVNATFPLCTNPPNTTDATKNCMQDWMNMSLSGLLGGGAGGGASMIWSISTSEDEPYLVAGAGGGTSRYLNHSDIIGSYVLDTTSLIEENESNSKFYRRWINARLTDSDAANENGLLRGIVGKKPTEELVSGAGGGWYALVPPELIDGKLLSESDKFAWGGAIDDCLTGVDNIVFDNVVGGFGGGGATCGGSGGGGGGFGGGTVLAHSPYIPGGGGYSINNINAEFVDWNEGDGYVEIVPADCGCQYSSCVVAVMQGTYECTCPQHTVPIGNGLDCITDMQLDIIQRSNVTVQRSVADKLVTFTLVKLPLAVTVYSIVVAYAVNQEEAIKRQINDGNINCIVVWLDSDSVPVLVSNSADTVVFVNGTVSLSPVSMLDEGVTVSAGVIVSDGDCTVAAVYANASIMSGEPVNTSNLADVIQEHLGIFLAIVNLTLPPTEMTQATQPGMTSGPNLSLIIGLACGMVALVIVSVLIVVAILLYCRKRHGRPKSRSNTQVPQKAKKQREFYEQVFIKRRVDVEGTHITIPQPGTNSTAPPPPPASVMPPSTPPMSPTQPQPQETPEGIDEVDSGHTPNHDDPDPHPPHHSHTKIKHSAGNKPTSKVQHNDPMRDYLRLAAPVLHNTRHNKKAVSFSITAPDTGDSTTPLVVTRVHSDNYPIPSVPQVTVATSMENLNVPTATNRKHVTIV